MKRSKRRRLYAAAALQGMLAADAALSGPRWSGPGAGEDYQRGGGKWVNPKGVAKQAFEIADAMLKQERK